jgi:hypothetical protein
MDLVGKYWAGVRQRLRAEVDIFAGLVEHNLERGEENEAAFARVLQSFVPDRYGIGSGLLIDRHGKASKQMDIILFEQTDEPKVLAQTNQLLYPVENVVAVIEIKTRLTIEEIADYADKRKSVSDLDSNTGEYPVFATLAYKSEVAHDTTAKSLKAHPPGARVDLACVLDSGLLSGTAALLRQKQHAPSDFVTGMALLRDEVSGAWVKAPKVVRGMRHRHDGEDYRITRVGTDLVLVDEARTLLLFVEALARIMAERTNRPEPVMSCYLKPESRLLVDIT